MSRKAEANRRRRWDKVVSGRAEIRSKRVVDMAAYYRAREFVQDVVESAVTTWHEPEPKTYKFTIMPSR